jgi:type II secretory pathway pseudopilin PulG
MSPRQQPPGDRGRSLEVEWTTISYRTIGSYAFLALMLVGIAAYLISPQYVTQKAKRVLESIAGDAGQVVNSESAAGRREAHFVNLDGTVRVKKARSLQWIRADYNTSLEKGDFVQTGSDGVARIIFADGTNYMVRADALIVVEESREDPVTRATKVAVQVTSGAVDLSTGRFETPGSTSQVAFADAVASMNQESRAVVRNDPDKNVHEITMDQGQAEVTRGSTSVQLGQYEQISFVSQQAGLVRTKLIAPPTLLLPQNMELKLVRDPRSAALEFSWTEVPEAKAYHLRISPSVMLTNFAVDKKITGRTSAQISGLDEGNYYWVVSAIDAKGAESEPSQANRLNLVQEVAGNQAYLEITKIIQHGRVVEVQGKTEPGSTVIINNEQVFSISPDGTFRHFTSPLPNTGSNQITITAQDRKGDTDTIRKTVVIE